jgi:prophage regulatory protein
MPDHDRGALLRLAAVCALTGVKKSLLYELMKEPDPADRFPRPVRLSARAVAWKEDEVRAWMAARPRTDEVAA